MGDLLCAVCSEPWDAWGLHHGDVMAWEARLFKAGAGCPSCAGISPKGETPADRDARELAAVEAASNNWDDPDSFHMVLDAFASAAFAYHMLAVNRELCTMVMDAIGSWPSSEVELRELQRCYR